MPEIDDQNGNSAQQEKRAGFAEIFGRVFLILLAICFLGWILLPFLAAILGVVLGFIGLMLGLLFSLGWIFALLLPLMLVAAVVTLVIMVANRLIKGPSAG